MGGQAMADTVIYLQYQGPGCSSLVFLGSIPVVCNQSQPCANPDFKLTGTLLGLNFTLIVKFQCAC
jgi:hypothetical protein